LQEQDMNRMHTLAAAAVLALGTSAFAGPVEFDFNSTQSVKNKGSFTGTASYDNTTDQLTLDITNTSKGALTAFAFEVEKGDSAKFERPALSKWKDERNHKGLIKAPPYGTFEGGAAVNGRWNSTAGKLGIPSGQTEVFVFDITGANASSLTTGDFFTGSKPQIVASFTGFKGSHFKYDRASGFGSAVKTNTTNSTTPSGTSITPILTIQPPPVNGGPISSPITGPVGGSSVAVPLPAAAPAGFAMLGLFGVLRIVRRIRGMMT
jgi:hypothetical protein